MAYELRIVRKFSKLTLEEWKQAVSATNGVRLAPTNHVVKNPATGEVIEMLRKEGDAEALVENRWHLVFRWLNGKVSFVAPNDQEIPRGEVWMAARSLAQSLNAVIEGEEGEMYDIRTGKLS